MNIGYESNKSEKKMNLRERVEEIKADNENRRLME